MSDNRRNRRKNEREKKPLKNDITQKERIMGILSMVILFVVVVILVIYLAVNGINIS